MISMGTRTKYFLFLIGVGILAAPFFFHFHAKNEQLTISESPNGIKSDTPRKEPALGSQGNISLTSEDQSKLQTLEDILKSKNDNDPRLDRDFRHLSAQMKRSLYSRYQSFPREDRNGRGIIVFLIAREISGTEDIHFLRSVYEEAPCTNMDGCSAAPSNDPHHSGTENTSLNYPQLVGLYQMEKSFESNPNAFANPEDRAALQELLSKAKNFPVNSVQVRAARIANLLAKTGAK